MSKLIWDEINQEPQLTNAERLKRERQLITLYGTPREKEAIEQLFLLNRRLVMQIVIDACAYYGVHDEDDRNDLIQIGLIQLWRVLPKYDSTRRNEQGQPIRISTFAYNWIKQAVLHAIKQRHHLIHVPEGIESPHFLSLDAPAGEDEEGSLYDVLEAEDAEPLPQERDAVYVVLRRLWHELGDLRLTRYMELRLGLVDGKPRTQKEVGKQFRLTRESIRIAEEKIIEILQQHPYFRAWLEARIEG